MRKFIIALCLLVLLAGCGGKTTYWDVMLDPDTSLSDVSEPEEEMPDFDYLDSSAAAIVTREMEQRLDMREELPAGSVLSNAIIHGTYITVLEDTGDSCTLKITYPDVATALMEAEAALPSDAGTEELDGILLDVAEKVQKGEIPTLEGTYTLPIVKNAEGVASILWDLEAANAMSGGIAQYIAGGMGNE